MKLLRKQKLHPNILIAGGLPQYYEADTRSEKEISDDFKDQARILNPYVDFFYFDVLIVLENLVLVLIV